MIHNEYDLDADRLPSKEDLYAMLAQINQRHPLKGGRKQERPSKSLYSMNSTKPTLRKASEAADQLIARRKGEVS